MTFTVRRTWFLVAWVAVLAAAGLAACGGGRDGASGSPDAVVARVDGRAVHQSAVDQARAEARFTGGERSVASEPFAGATPSASA